MNKILLKGQTPDYAVGVAQTGAVWNGVPLPYRFDGEVGQFYCGSVEVGDSVWIQAIQWRWASGERWSRPNQSWFDVAFLDSENLVSILSLKKDSAVNVFEFLTRLSADGILVEAVQLRLGACQIRREPRSPAAELRGINPWDLPDIQVWHVVDVTEARWIGRAQCEAAQEFMASGEFDWRLVGEVDS
ncbi:hypothetical protein GS597_01330 [Synechococcales cyanobacterium C]|uniref:Uncharacterized protein n=1 Tax=Petrachloros mirabilis ULC683 TaxID=2781853 RepID=A0A8K2ANA7_9CYAN|nr:hypothetical protein [Petrachloros mirabilis]NCJ05181.1 hypothetical protein [Petrachloros mirabilis ULC683]